MTTSSSNFLRERGRLSQGNLWLEQMVEVHGIEKFAMPERAELLAQTAAAIDLIHELEVAQSDQGPTVTGGNGQPAVNPVIPELRQQRAALAKLLAQLAQLDRVESQGTRAARNAANARWTNARALDAQRRPPA